ncbi:hypothetical protein SLS63_009099 [Diaporthe eres]|uniref:C2H2-type domain-containing protein n=1 Tax=Diaporthe eres TaxID=83184 RepID=A0ABR1P0L8_DIAER
MSGYNDLFNFNTSDGAHDMPGSLNAEAAPTMDQSGTWDAALQPQSGLMEGGTTVQLHARLDFAPLEGARSNGSTINVKPTCAVCLEGFQTAHALDHHAKETSHQAYKCKCGTSFNKDSALKRHIDTKDTPKTFACPLCDSSFTRKDKLKDHCRLYHKVKGEWLQALFNSHQARPRTAASLHRLAPAPLARTSSATAPTLAPAPPRALAPAPAGPFAWSPLAPAGQQYANFSADLFNTTDPLAMSSPIAPTDLFGSSGAFVPAADPFASTPITGEGISGTLDGFFGDEAWVTGFDGFNF